MRKIKYYIFLAFLVCFRAVLAQEMPEIINLKPLNVSGKNQVWSIAQGKENIMYLAYSNGLALFDGDNYHWLQLPEKQIVRAVSMGKNDEVFVGGYGEFGFWKRDEHFSFKYHSLSNVLPLDKVKKEEIWHILVAKDVVYFQSFSTIYKYDYEKVEIITPPCNIMFLQLVNDKIFVQGIGQGIYEYRKNGFEFCSKTEILNKETVVSILPYNDKLLIFSANNGAFLYDYQAIKIWSNPLNSTLKRSQINRCLILKNGDLAIGTIQNGAYVIDNQGFLKFHFTKSNGLQNNTILSIFEDKASNLWLGLDQGADKITLNSNLRFFKDLRDNIGATYAAAKYKGKLFIGTNRGVFVKENEERFRLVDGTKGQVWFLQVVDNQLVCGHNDGTFIIYENATSQKVSTITGGWDLKKIPNSNDLYLEACYTGLLVFKNVANKLTLIGRISGFTEPVKTVIWEDAKHLWVANPYKGFYRLELSSDYGHVDRVEELFIDNKSSAEYSAKIKAFRDSIYIYTNRDIYFYDKNKAKIIKVNHTKGQFYQGIDNEYFEVLNDKIIQKSQGLKKLFNTSLIADYEVIVNLDTAQYLLGLDNGYALLNRMGKGEPPHLVSEPIISKILLRSGAELYPTNHLQSLSLTWKDNGMIFYFGNSEFNTGRKFRYQLLGYEKKWSEWQATPMKEFTNLSAGEYIFNLQCDNSDKICTIQFTISPPWYFSFWANILYFIALCFAVYALERWYRHRLTKQKIKLMHEQQLELEQIQLQNENALLQSTIQNKTKELASSAMSIVEKNEILMKIKDTLNEVKQEAGASFPSKYYQRLINAIDQHLDSDQDWLLFETNFNEVHEQFFKKLKVDFPELTVSDLRLAAYLKMGLSSKELAPLFNISLRGVENKRYRLRQKMNLSAEENLVEFLLKY